MAAALIIGRACPSHQFHPRRIDTVSHNFAVAGEEDDDDHEGRRQQAIEDGGPK